MAIVGSITGWACSPYSFLGHFINIIIVLKIIEIELNCSIVHKIKKILKTLIRKFDAVLKFKLMQTRSKILIGFVIFCSDYFTVCSNYKHDLFAVLHLHHGSNKECEERS